MTAACNQSMPRVKPGRRRAAVWWTEEISGLRRKSIRTRREYLRRKRSDATSDEIKFSWEESQVAQHELAAAIRKTKARAWDELINELNRDPWGRLYRVVSGKLRPWAPPLTERLDPCFVETIVGILFPQGQGNPNWGQPGTTGRAGGL